MWGGEDEEKDMGGKKKANWEMTPFWGLASIFSRFFLPLLLPLSLFSPLPPPERDPLISVLRIPPPSTMRSRYVGRLKNAMLELQLSTRGELTQRVHINHNIQSRC
jgi:hypothetical protein